MYDSNSSQYRSTCVSIQLDAKMMRIMATLATFMHRWDMYYGLTGLGGRPLLYSGNASCKGPVQRVPVL